MSTKKITIASILTLIFSIALLAFAKTHSGNNEANAGYPVKKIMQYSYTLKNDSNKLLPEVHFWTFAPVKQTSSQRSAGLEVSDPYELVEDAFGNQIIHFTISNFPPFGSKIVRIKAEVGMADKPFNLPNADHETYLKAEKFVEVDNENIIKLASKLKADTSIKTAEKTHQWVANNIKYTGFAGKEQGALYAFNNKKGDCTEYMDLFVALMRANNIPARRIGGYVMQRSGNVEPTDFHNWAEFYDGKAWRMADPQENVFNKNHMEYVALNILDENLKNSFGIMGRYKVDAEDVQVQMTM